MHHLNTLEESRALAGARATAAAPTTGTRTKRTGLLAVAVALSAGIHAALVPEHLQEMPPLGYAFIAAAVIGSVLAWALVSRPRDRRLPLLAALFCLGQIGTWALFVTLPVPGFTGTPESIETIAVVSKATEALGAVLALSLITFPALRRWRRSRRARVVAQDA